MFQRVLIFWVASIFAASGVRAGSLLELQRALTAGAHHSLSGQFVIHDLPPELALQPALIENTNLMDLDPTLLTISCERIKKTLLTELGMRDEWRGKIYISLHRAENGDEAAVVSPARFERDWIYRLDLPQRMERPRLVSAIVEVLLLEISERNSIPATQIPAWLSQGMTREVMLSSEEELVLEKPHHMENGLNLARLTRTNLFTNPLMQTHEEMMSVPPLTLEDLSWPKPEQFDGVPGEAYRCSAQLFLHQLLQLNDGHQCMRNFLGELPGHLNWQIGFLRAFHSHFGTQLEVEKWWALQLVQFTGRDIAQTWRPDESWQKLDELVRPSVEVRTSPNELPLRTQVTLQSIIRDWPIGRQVQLFQDKSRELLLLRMRISPDLIYLVDDYRKLVDGYVQKRTRSGVTSMGKSFYVAPQDNVAHETIRAFDLLEVRRQQLRPNPQIVPAITANNPSVHY